MNIWEEKNLTAPPSNCEKCIPSTNGNIITETKNDCEKNECENIGWTRNCPMCNKVIIYREQSNFCRARRENYKCKECGKKFSGAKRGRKDSPETKEKKRQSMLGKKFPPEFGEAVRKRMLGNKNSTGKPKPPHWKEKLIAKMARNWQEPSNIGKSFLPNYNEIACEYFNWLNKFMGWNGQYATHWGEKNVLNYFVDYYEPSINIVIEWDEPHHKNQTLKDEKRKDDIKKAIGCKFFRYDGLTNRVKEV